MVSMLSEIDKATSPGHHSCDYKVDFDGAVKTIKHFAPKGKIYYVVRVEPDGYRRLRIYGIRNNELTRVDQMTNKELFEAVRQRMHYDQDAFNYYGWDRTDGTRGSGYGWPSNAYSNVCWGILYALAEVVHGDRNAWQLCPL
jgi:hypothetical protein